jgi:diguanylate cyclase (GGDEF)-like protein/PAS domain S-box-containing protein
MSETAERPGCAVAGWERPEAEAPDASGAAARPADTGQEVAFRQLFHANPVPMWVYDRETLRFLEVNDAAVETYGWPRETFLGMTILDIRPPEDAPSVRRGATLVGKGRRVSGPWRHRDAAGRERLVRVMSHPLRFAGREAVLVAAWDDTERLRAEAALREREEILHLCMRAGRVGAYRRDFQAGRVHLSPEARAVLGLPPGDGPITARRWCGALLPEDRRRIRAEIAAAHRRRAPEGQYEYRIRRPGSGEIRHVESRARYTYAPDGRPLGSVGVLIDVTERRRAEAALAESEAFARSLIEGSADCIRVHDRAGRLLFMNAAGLRAMGIADLAEVQGRPYAEFWPEEELPKVRAAAREAVAGRVGRFTCYLPGPSGERRWWEATLCPVPAPGGGPAERFVSILRDVTEARRAQEEARALAERLSAVLEGTTDSVLVLDRDWRVTYANRRAGAMFPGRLRPGAHLWEEFPEEAEGPFARHYRRALAEGRPVVFEARLAASGTWLEVHAFPMAGGGLSVFFRDVTERRRAEEQLAHLASHDALTGLPNRVRFRERLEAALARCAAGGRAVALLCVDLDHFKAVNDTLGHAAGDALLCQVAARLRGCVREGDLVARLGGDEFAVLQEEVRRPADAAALARRIVRTLSMPYDLEGRPALVGASVGIALALAAPAAGRQAEDLLREADVALYRAKAEGRGRCRLFETGMDERLRRRQALKPALRGAAARGEFELHYQPVVDLASERAVAFEALLRWRRPGGRGPVMVPPAEFVPVAEEAGLIGPIGEWVLRAACREAAGWPEGISVAVNLSPAQFADAARLVRSVAGALRAAGLAPGRLELEVTETVLLRDEAANLAALRALRALGVRLAMDDFGTGFSSLGYLRSFRFDKIKIDRSFVSDLPRGEQSLAIVRAAVGLGRALGMAVVAEGVETPEQLSALRGEGCALAQGFLWGRAVPAEEVPALLRGLSPDVFPPRRLTPRAFLPAVSARRRADPAGTAPLPGSG